MPDFQSGEVPEVDVSVLIVTYNSSSTLTACLDSLIPELESVDGEAIIVDNHSSDDTPKLLETYETKHPRIQIELNRVNRGFAIGNNQALKRARGEQIFILNPDTILAAGSIRALLDELKKGERIGLVAPQLKFPDGRLQKTCRRFPRHMDVVYNVFGFSRYFPMSKRFNGWKMGDFDHLSAMQVDQPAGAAMLVRGTLLRELNGFDPNFPMFFNDVDLCKRIKDQGFEIWYCPEVVIQHVGGASVKKVKLKMTVSSHVSFFRYFEKHFTRLHQQPLNFLVGVLLYLSLIPRILTLLFLKNQSDVSRDTL